MKTETCIICGEPACGHHFIRRLDLRKDEYKDKRFQIPLCLQHHQEFHFDKETSGLAFYEKYNLLDLICNKCGFDRRFMRWVEAQRYKQKGEK